MAGHPDWEALSDPEALERPRAQDRALVHQQLARLPLLDHEAITPGGAGHFGMIFMPSAYRWTRAHTGTIIAALEVILARYPAL